MTFVEAPTNAAHIGEIPKQLPWPQIINIVIGGRTPELSNDKLKSMGYAAALYANVALQAAVHGMQLALRGVHRLLLGQAGLDAQQAELLAAGLGDDLGKFGAQALVAVAHEG